MIITIIICRSKHMNLPEPEFDILFGYNFNYILPLYCLINTFTECKMKYFVTIKLEFLPNAKEWGNYITISTVFTVYRQSYRASS